MRRQLAHAQSALVSAEKVSIADLPLQVLAARVSGAARPKCRVVGTHKASNTSTREASCHAQEAEAATAAAEEARAALAAEQGRAFKLEAQVAELRQALSRSADLERELEVSVGGFPSHCRQGSAV